MGNELSQLIPDDLQVQLEQLQKLEAEQKARELLVRETTVDRSYQQIIQRGFTGFVETYLKATVDYNTMTTRANQKVVISLAKFDL